MTDTNLDSWRKSPAFLAQHDSLPSTLRSNYTQLVEEYRYFALIHHKHPFVSYRVLAELIRSGWRPNDEPMSAKEKKND